MPGNEGRGELWESRVGEEDMAWRSCRGGSTKPVLLTILLRKKSIEYNSLQLQLSEAALTTTNFILVKLYHPHLYQELPPNQCSFLCICHQFTGLTYCRRVTETIIFILQAQYVTRKFKKSLLLPRISHNFCYASYKELPSTETNAFQKRLTSTPFTAHLFKNRAIFYNAKVKSNQ